MARQPSDSSASTSADRSDSSASTVASASDGPSLGAATVRRALAAGVVHALVGYALATALDAFVPEDPFLLAYVLGGGVLVAAVPAGLLDWRRLLSPAVVVVALLAAAAYANWSTYVAPSPTPTPVGPTVFGWYLLGWPAVLAAALVAGGAERLVRGLWHRRSDDSAA